MIALDNSVLAKYARRDPDPNVVSRLQRYSSHRWAAPSIVTWEFYSAYSSASDVRRVKRELDGVLDEVLPFTDDVAASAAILDASLADHDVTLDTADLLIAATARDAGATLVTADADFDAGPLRDLMDVDVVEPAD